MNTSCSKIPKNQDAPDSTRIVLFSCLGLALVGLMFQFYLRPFLAEPSGSTLHWKASLKEGVGQGAPPSLSASLPQNLSGPAQMALGIKIDLNRAGVEDLAVLPGVGQKMGERIVEDRQRKGPFHKVKDLMRIEGIKEKKFLQIEPYVTAEP